MTFPFFSRYDVAALSWMCTFKEKVEYGEWMIHQVQITRNFFRFHPATHTTLSEGRFPRSTVQIINLQYQEREKRRGKKESNPDFSFGYIKK